MADKGCSAGTAAADEVTRAATGAGSWRAGSLRAVLMGAAIWWVGTAGREEEEAATGALGVGWAGAVGAEAAAACGWASGERHGRDQSVSY